MPKKSSKNLPIYEYDKKVNGQTRYYIRPYVNGKQTTYRLDENRNMWLGRDGYQQARNYCVLLASGIKEEKHNNCKMDFQTIFYEKIEYDKLHNNLSESSCWEYERTMKTLIFPLPISKKSINKWTVKDYEKLLKYLKDKKIDSGRKKGQNMSLGYIEKICTIISGVLSYGVKFYGLKYNVANKVGKIKENRNKIKDETLSEMLSKNKTIDTEDWNKFLKVANDCIEQENNIVKKIKLYEILLLITCEHVLFMRIGEVQAMKWGNLYDNIYLLKEQYNHKIQKLCPPKNRKNRLIYIPETLKETLYKLRSTKIELGIYNENEFIFGGDRVMPRTTINTYRKKWCIEANIKYFSNHFLRHAGESYSLSYKADPTALAEMAGHNIKVMFDTYINGTQKANDYLTEILNNIAVPKTDL